MFVKRTVKEIGIVYIYPILVLWVIYPVLLIFFKNKISAESMKEVCILINQAILPIIALICPAAHISETIEGIGNELLFVWRRDRLFQTIMWIVVYFVLLIPCFYIQGDMLDFSDIKLEYARTCIQSMMVSSAFYMLCFITHSIGAAVVVNVFYVIYASTFADIGAIWNFYDYHMMTMRLLEKKYFVFVVLTIVMLAIGKVLNNRHLKFN